MALSNWNAGANHENWLKVGTRIAKLLERHGVSLAA
jgi:hypothetical protein